MTVLLDAHAKPPELIRDLYKRYQKASRSAVLEQPDLIQLFPEQNDCRSVEPARNVEYPDDLRVVFDKFMHKEISHSSGVDDRGIYEVPEIPGKNDAALNARLTSLLNKVGLYIYPSLLPAAIQIELLERLLHRDVSSQEHSTNVHLFHHVDYPTTDGSGKPRSFFDPAADHMIFEPIDPAVHKPFDIQQFWNKKLRWVTLGGQYDWTKKQYPQTAPPAFPQDIKRLVEDLFPMKAEAAILNLYSPGDTLSLHRDVSEESDQPLVSISLGCDAIFIVGLGESGCAENECKSAAIRLRSGDAVLMSGPSRYAWHGVPKVLPGSCPTWMCEWPATGEGTEYQSWKTWMASKRINLNVRQMFD